MLRVFFVSMVIVAVVGAQPPGRRDALAHYGAGVLKAHRDELASGLKELEQAVKADPTATAPLRSLVPIYIDLGRQPAAERAARKVLEANPDDAAIGITLGKLLNNAGKAAEAKPILVRAVAAAKKADDANLYEAALQELVRAQVTTQDWAAGTKTLEQLIELRRGLKGDVAELYVRVGKIHTTAHNWEAAGNAFLAAGAADPAMAKVLARHLAMVFSAKGDSTEAIVYRKKDLATNPRGVAPYRDAAQDWLSAKQDPVPILQAHIDTYPTRMEARWVLAYETGRRTPADATTAKETLIRFAAQSEDPELYALVAEYCANIAGAASALTWLESVSNAATTDAGASRRRLVLAAQAIANNPDLARGVVVQATQDLKADRTHSATTWEYISWLAERTGQADACGLAAVQAFQNRNFSSEVCFKVFQYYERKHEWEELIRACDVVSTLRKEGVMFTAMITKAHALAEADQGEDALAVLVDMTRRFDWSAGGKLSVRINRIRILNMMARHDQAMKEAKSLLEEQAAFGDKRQIRFVLSDSYGGLKKYAEAEAELRQVLEEDPDDVLALNNLGYSLADQGRKLVEAEELVRRAIALDSDSRARAGNAIRESGVYLDSLAWVQFRRGNLIGAKATFAAALKNPDAIADPIVWDHAGDLALNLKDYATAKAYWTKAEEGYSKSHLGRKQGRLDEVRRKLTLIPK